MSQHLARPLPIRPDPFRSCRWIESRPDLMAHQESLGTSQLPPMHEDPLTGRERLSLDRLRAQVQDQEAELREKGVQLAMLSQELQTERLRHDATRETLEGWYKVAQRSVDAEEVIKWLRLLAN